MTATRKRPTCETCNGRHHTKNCKAALAAPPAEPCPCGAKPGELHLTTCGKTAKGAICTKCGEAGHFPKPCEPKPAPAVDPKPPSAHTLYQRSDELAALLAEVTELVDLGAEATSEDLPAVSEALQAKSLELLAGQQSAFDQKLEAVALYFIEQQRQRQVTDTEVDRLRARSRVVANRLEWFKKYMKDAMLAVDMKKLATPLVTVRIQKTAPMVELMDITDVPESMRRVVPEKVELDKAAALAYYKRHEDVPPGCKVVDDRSTLVVK